MNGLIADPASGAAFITAQLVRVFGGVTSYWNGTAWVATDPGYIPTGNVPTVGATNSTWTIGNGPSAGLWGEGTFTLTVKGTDVAGNVSAGTVSVFSIDTVAPTVTIDTVTPDPARTGAVTVTVTASDVTTGVASAPTITVQQSGAAISAPIAATTCSVNAGAPAAPPAGFPAAPGAPVSCTYSYTVAGGPDGNATIVASATDAAGNVGTATRQFVVDTIAPTFMANVNPSPARGGVPIAITVIGTDATSGLGAAPVIDVTTFAGTPSGPITATSCTPSNFPVLPGGSTLPASGGNVAQLSCTYTYTGPTATTEDGVATIAMTGQDRAGNAITTSATFILDNTLPAVTITAPTASQSFTNANIATIAFTGSATDNASAAANSGVQTVAGKLTRTVGSTTTYFNGSLFVATDPGGYPVTTSLSPAGGAGVLSASWTGNEPATWLDGSYTLTVHAVDAAGNVSPDVSVTFFVDTQPPVVQILSATPDPAGLGTLTIVAAARDDSSGLPAAPTVTVTQNGGGTVAATLSGCAFTSGGFPTSSGVVATCTYTYAVTGGPDGTAVVRATASDLSGNTATTTRNVQVDTTAPVVNITSPTTVQVRGQSGTLPVSFTYTEAHPASYVIELVVSGGGSVLLSHSVGSNVAAGTANVSFTFPLTTVPDGVYDVVVRMLDTATPANLGTDTEVGKLILDSTPPFATVTNPANGSITAAIASLSGSATDPAGPSGGTPSGIATVKVSLKANAGANLNKYWNGSAWASPVAPANAIWLNTDNGSPVWVSTAPMPPISMLEQVAYTACVYAVDVAGNTQSPASCSTFNLDLRPRITLTAPDTAGSIVPRSYTPVTITFSENVFSDAGVTQLAAADYGTLVRLEQGALGGPLVPAVATYSAATKTFSIAPTPDSQGATFLPNTTYYVVVQGCTGLGCPAGIRDSVGNTLGDALGSSLGQFVLNFKTPDTTTLNWSSGGSLPNMITARREFAAVTYNGIYYAIGGLTASGPSNAVEKYDPVTNQWTSLAPLAPALQAPAAAAYNGKIYVFGGGTGSAWVQTVKIYNIATNTWSTGTQMPTKRAYMAAAELNGRIYLVGGTCQQAIAGSGCTANGVQTNLVEAYVPNATTGTWIQRTSIAQMPTPRSQLTLTAVNNRLWAIGGPAGTGNKVEIYDPTAGSTGAWTAGPTLPASRSLHAAGVLNGYLYVVGGLAPSAGAGQPATATNTVYVYDPLLLTGGTWSTGPAMNETRVAFGGSVGIVSASTANPPVLRFIAAGGSNASSGPVTNTMTLGAGG